MWNLLFVFLLVPVRRCDQPEVERHKAFFAIGVRVSAGNSALRGTLSANADAQNPSGLHPQPFVIKAPRSTLMSPRSRRRGEMP